jgi:uncharacterized phage infection (PIP) family protein YhgE
MKKKASFWKRLDQFFSYERTKHLTLTATLICLVWLSVEVTWLLRASRVEFEAQSRAFNMLTDKFSQRTDRILDHFENSAAAVDRTTSKMETNVDLISGHILNSTDNIDQTVDQLRADLRQSVSSVNKSLGNVEQISENLVLLTSDPRLRELSGHLDDVVVKAHDDLSQLEVILKDGTKISANGVLISDNTVEVSSNLASMTKSTDLLMADTAGKVHSILNPPPAKGIDKWLLTPFKKFGGIVWFTVKMVNGF